MHTYIFNTVSNIVVSLVYCVHNRLYDHIKYIIYLLIYDFLRVAKFSDTNKMLASNLAVVFAPTIMRSPNSDSFVLADLPLQKKLVEFIINNCSCLFE